MSQQRQRTLAGGATVEGVGVHSGETAVLTLRPAEPGTGVRFRRTDLEGSPEVPADLDHIADTHLGTTLAEGEVRIKTVEHVLAALAAHRIHNAVVELDGPEPPIGDGSFSTYSQAIVDVGALEQDAPARFIDLRSSLEVSVPSGASYVARPGSDLRISATIEFDHPEIGRQFGTFDVSEETFARELAPARTFGFRADAEALRARGLALGASLENTVVLDETGVMNPELRFSDEFLRHKIGDIVGDLALLGAGVRADVVADRPSHEGNVALARALAARATSEESARVVEAHQLMRYLPHRYPMLLVDRIVEFEPEKRIVGIKNVTINEPFFQGHFPGHPVMPGVLLVEAMAQVGGLLLMESEEDPDDKVVYFMSMDGVKWRRPVRPGDQVVFEVKMVRYRPPVCKIAGVGRVEGTVVVEGEMTARIMDR